MPTGVEANRAREARLSSPLTMTGGDVLTLDSVRFAELVAPAISRVFVTGMRAAAAADHDRSLVGPYGGPEVVECVIDLRNPLAAGRSITAAGLRDHYRYTDPADIESTIDRSVVGGLLQRDADGTIEATGTGQQFLADLFAHHADVLTERWNPAVIERLNPLLARVLRAADATGGGAWSVQSPPHEPAGKPSAVVLLDRLSTMRYHRADAHAAAWLHAGWTAADVAAMPWGTVWSEERRQIERDTNRRAASPYNALTGDERLSFLADLAAIG